MITPYSKITTIDMWTDPYISKQMLKYHLEKHNDIASRKEETIIKTVNFISDYVAKKVSICDFGCGPGLYTDKLQRKGHDVTGVDISKTSLDFAKSNNKKVDYRQMNYIDQKLNKKIDAAMMIYCDFAALPPLSQVKFLSNLSESLSEEGLFFFDVFSHHRFNGLTENENTYTQTDGFFMKGNCEIKSGLVKYDRLKLSLSYDKAVGSKTVELYNWDKHYDLNEMKVLLNDNGFEIIDYYSDTTGNKEFEKNDLLFFVCKKVK